VKDEIAVLDRTWRRRTNVIRHEPDHARIGVEESVEISDVPRTEGAAQDLWIPEVSIPTAESRVVVDVPRALLEVAHEAAPLEDLGQQVRCLLARKVNGTKLGYGVVAVLEEHFVVEALRLVEPNRGIHRTIAGHIQVLHELIKEEPSERLRAPAVAGEQCTLHNLGKVD